MRKILLASSVALLGLGAVAGSVQACPTVSLPTATASNTVTFGDAVSYSLPILGISVPSSPGQIGDCIVIATGTSGSGINTNVAGADNPYPTPSGVAGSPFFSTGNPATQPDPAAAFAGQTAVTWDITTAALQAALGAGATPVIMFNHNQVNSGDSTNQNLFIWAQVALVDLDTGNTVYLYASAVNNPTGLPNFGIPGGDPAAFTGPQSDALNNTYPLGSDAAGFPSGGFCGIPGAPACGTNAQYMINAQGQVCLNGPVGVGTPIPCDGSGGPVVATVNHNLGADEAANAIVFPELNALLALGIYDVIQVDIRMGCNPATITAINGPESSSTAGCPAGSPLNNGFEQIFIVAGVSTTQVPEPSSLALLGAALFGAGWLYRRRRTH